MLLCHLLLRHSSHLRILTHLIHLLLWHLSHNGLGHHRMLLGHSSCTHHWLYRSSTHSWLGLWWHHDRYDLWCHSLRCCTWSTNISSWCLGLTGIRKGTKDLIIDRQIFCFNRKFFVVKWTLDFIILFHRYQALYANSVATRQYSWLLLIWIELIKANTTFEYRHLFFILISN